MHLYHKPVDLPFELPTRIYAGMLAVWLLRPNLQQRFPLHKNRRTDYLRFLAWCTAIGRRECTLLTEIDAWNRELYQPVNLPSLRNDRWENTFNMAMYLAGLHRGKYWGGQILGNKTLRHRAARWYFREGRHLLNLEQIPAWQIEALQKQFSDYQDFIHYISLPKDDAGALEQLKGSNSDIMQRWDTESSAPVPPSKDPVPANPASTFIAGVLPVACNRVGAFFRLKCKKPSTSQVTPVAQKLNQHLQAPMAKNLGDKPFGVNLYGYAHGELGIGEDVRMLALAFQAVDIPFCIVNIEPAQGVSQKDTSASGWVVAEPRYNINIFCITGIEMCRHLCIIGTKFLHNHYNIGLWPWELPEWPEPWHHAWSLVDELWGISKYTSAAYAKAPVPVHPVPLPVEIAEVAELGRDHWNLPESAYLFVFSFDMNSKLARKNPTGLIRAFQKASAGKGVDEAGLVLKISHLKRHKPEWKTLEKLINHDPRIHLINAELRRPEVLALYQACDCYVSLHRSEGFGRGLAEAQLLGLRLIATGYSGNMEFCAEPPTLCVDYSLCDLRPGEYFYGDGQYWADPDIDHAAHLIQQCLKQRDLAEYRKSTINYETRRFTPAYCGEHFKHRLQTVIKTALPEERKHS